MHNLTSDRPTSAICLAWVDRTSRAEQFRVLSSMAPAAERPEWRMTLGTLAVLAVGLALTIAGVL